MSQQLLDKTSKAAFRAAKLRYAIIIGSVITVIITCIGLIVYQQIQKNKLAKIAKEYSEINSLYYQENLQEPNAVQNSSLAPKQSVDHAKSMALFAQFAKKHAKEPYGWQAAIRTGNYYINQGNIQAAKELFEAIIPHTRKFPLIQIKIGTTLAGIYAQQNEEAKALQQLEYISKIPANPASNELKLFESQILHTFGKIEEARQISNTLNTSQAKIWDDYIGPKA